MAPVDPSTASAPEPPVDPPPATGVRQGILPNWIHPETQDLLGNILMVSAVLELISNALPGLRDAAYGTGSCVVLADGVLAYGFFKGKEWAPILTRVRCVFSFLALPAMAILGRNVFPLLGMALYVVPLFLLAGPRGVALRARMLPLIVVAGILACVRIAAIALGVDVPFFT